MKKFDRLRRQQQRLWRKAAVSILSLHHNIAIVLAFLMITVLGIFWILLDQKLERHLLDSARNYGYGISRYSSTDLKALILEQDKSNQLLYLKRLTDDPMIIEAKLFDQLGTLLSKSSSSEITPLSRETNTLNLLEDIDSDGQRIGILELIIDRNFLEKPINKLLNILALFTVVMMISSILLAWLVSKRLTKPLRKLLRYPVTTPDEKAIINIDVSSELKAMLESSTATSDSPAPVSRAEESGIHQLLAADSVAHSGEVIVLKLYLPDLNQWLDSDSGTKKVRHLRKLDRLLIMTIHSQQGHLLSFDGITAQACFGLDGDLDSAVYRSVSCSLMLEKLLLAMPLATKISLRKEQRLLIRHMKRTPVAIPTHVFEDDKELLFERQQSWLMLHNNISHDKRLLDQITLTESVNNWLSIKQIKPAAESMLERQLTWIRYMLDD